MTTNTASSVGNFYNLLFVVYRLTERVRVIVNNVNEIYGLLLSEVVG
jgi:hypothetical protein